MPLINRLMPFRFLVSWFIDFGFLGFQFLDLWVLGFLVDWFLGFGFNGSKFQGFNNPVMLLKNVGFIIPKCHSRFLIDIDPISNIFKIDYTDLHHCSAPVFSNNVKI